MSLPYVSWMNKNIAILLVSRFQIREALRSRLHTNYCRGGRTRKAAATGKVCVTIPKRTMTYRNMENRLCGKEAFNRSSGKLGWLEFCLGEKYWTKALCQVFAADISLSRIRVREKGKFRHTSQDRKLRRWKKTFFKSPSSLWSGLHFPGSQKWWVLHGTRHEFRKGARHGVFYWSAPVSHQ